MSDCNEIVFYGYRFGEADKMLLKEQIFLEGLNKGILVTDVSVVESGKERDKKIDRIRQYWEGRIEICRPKMDQMDYELFRE